MRRIDKNANQIVSAFLGLADAYRVCILDSCGVGHLGSHLLMAGAEPAEVIEFAHRGALEELNLFLQQGRPVIFTISYELGPALNKIESRHCSPEPMITAAAFEALIVHDYDTGETSLIGGKDAADRLESRIDTDSFTPISMLKPAAPATNFSHDGYVAAVHNIQERIRDGDTYQTNLTRRITAELSDELTPEQIFWRLRMDNPAPFAAFIGRSDSTVISASPERFFRVENGFISTSPIKGTRPRGRNREDDTSLREELIRSSKDRAENTMIVDLLRNDLGRICEYGSIAVEQLCQIEEHPSLFHMVSTISGRLRSEIGFREIVRALFPCGSITGAPKVSTMRIIDEIEPLGRGLSMGAIGIYMPASFGMGEFIDTSVAIRTMTLRNGTAEFNVGGGIVIDSDPHAEWKETETKAKALLQALGVV